MSTYDISYAPPPPPLINPSKHYSSLVTPKLVVYNGTVTQDTSTTTDVVLNTSHGVITCYTSTLAALTEESFTFYNTNISSTSVVVVSVSNYSGSQGLPQVRLQSVSEGNCTVVVQNLSDADALDGVVTVEFFVV